MMTTTYIYTYIKFPVAEKQHQKKRVILERKAYNFRRAQRKAARYLLIHPLSNVGNS